MPGLLLDVGAKAECIDKAKMLIKKPFKSRVKLDKEDACTLTDIYTISGCNRDPPCLFVTWSTAASKVKIDGSAAILDDSKGFTVNGDIQNLTSRQQRVRGT
jgi:hypothetical protein